MSKSLREWESGLVNSILNRHPEGYSECTVVGEPGTGKSIYCYLVIAKVLYILNGYYKNDHEEDAFKEALKYMLFEPEDFIRLIYTCKSTEQKVPAICLDDASVHMGRQLWRLDPNLYMELEGLVPTVRTAFTGFLINTPKAFLLAKFLREFQDHKAKIIMLKGFRDWRRMARHYIKHWYPDDRKFRITIPYLDTFSCYLKNEYFEMYMKKKMLAEVSHAEKVHNRQENLHKLAEKGEALSESIEDDVEEPE